MSSDVCVNCGQEAQEHHHVVPKSLGGTYTVPLCSVCHGIVHDLPNRANHKELTKRSFDRKNVEQLCYVWWWHFYEHKEIDELADEMGVSKNLVARRIRRVQEMTASWRKELFSPIVGEIKYFSYELP